MNSYSNKFPRLNLPPVDLRTRMDGDNLKVFDPLRKKYVALTPEEYVRQHFTAWLQNTYNYPASIIANEIGLDLNGMKKRCDTVIFNSDGSPLVIIEYKAPNISITQSVFDQIVRYNMALHARYLIVSNGLSHYCCVINYSSNTYNFIPFIPNYNDIRTGFSNN